MRSLVITLLVLLAVGSSWESIGDGREELPPYLDELDYLDRDLIVKGKISKLTLTISSFDRDNPVFDESLSEEQIEDIKTSCAVHLTRFDKKGNLTGHKLRRVSSWVVYKYNDSNKITQGGWENKRDGTLRLWEKTSADLLNIQTQHETRLKSKVRLDSPHEKTIVDICSSFDGVYLISSGEYKNGLPLKAKAKLLRHAEMIFKQGHESSHKELFIYFDYEFDNYVDLDWGKGKLVE